LKILNKVIQIYEIINNIIKYTNILIIHYNKLKYIMYNNKYNIYNKIYIICLCLIDIYTYKLLINIILL